MTTTKTKKCCKNKKMKLLKHIEGGAKGVLLINKDYLDNRMRYTYQTLFPASLRQTIGDNSDSPFYLLKSSANIKVGDFKADSGTDIFGIKLSTVPIPEPPSLSDGTVIPVAGFLDYYKNYISGNLQRAAEFETKTADLGDTIISGLLGLVDSVIGNGKQGHSKLSLKQKIKKIKQYQKLHGGRLADMVPPAITTKTTYDEFNERTELPKRIGILKIKQFILFCDYINEIGRVYRKDLLRFIKDNMDRVYPVGDYIDFNKTDSTAAINNMLELLRKQQEPMYKFGPNGEMIPIPLSERAPSLAQYGDIPPPAPDADASKIATYKGKIRSVNNAIYNSIRNQVTDNPENPSLIIPSPFWFGGDSVKVTGDLDIRTTIPESLYTELLALEQAFEKEVFNAKVPQLFQFLKNGLQELNDTFIAEGRYIAQVIQAQAGQPVQNDTNTDLLRAEYKKQYDADATLHMMEKVFETDKDKGKGMISTQVEKGFKWVMKKTREYESFEKWLEDFIISEEYDIFVNSNNVALVDADIARDKDYQSKMNPQLDMKKLTESKTFYNADVFADEDVDSLNVDLIKTLRDQEDEFNKTIKELEGPFVEQQEVQKKKNQDALEAVKTKITNASSGLFEKLDEGMVVNKQNRTERQKEDAKRIIEEASIEDEESALAKLRNYKGCTSGPPREPTPKRVFEDVNLQDIITDTGKQLSGGKKKNNSVAEQIYLLNKRYVDSYGYESPMVKTNSARKTGGATETSTVDPELNIQGATTDYIDTAADEKAIEDLTLATNILNTAELVVGFIPVIGDALSLVMGIASMVMGDEIAKKERELEEKRKENDRLIDSWYAWKDNMESQVVLTLSTQEDPRVYEVMKTNALDSYRKMDPRSPPTSREIRLFARQLDDERNMIITSRKAITDQFAQNAQDITGVIADILQSQDDASSDLLNEGFEERKKVIEEFTTRLKDYVKKFMEDQGKLDDEDAKVQEQADAVSKMVADKEDELDDEADDIAELKGYSGCSANVKSNEEMRQDAIEDLEEQQEQLEEDQAQGKVPIQGLGKRHKKHNKNSIANQVYMLNMRFIKSF